MNNESRQDQRTQGHPTELSLSANRGGRVSELSRLSPLHASILFTLEPGSSPWVARYEPEFLGMGAEQLVYAIPRSSRTVAKLHTQDIVHGASVILGHPLNDTPTISPVERLALEGARLKQVELHFGYRETLRQRAFIHELRLPKLLIAAVTGSRSIERDLTIPVGVTLQRYAQVREHPGSRGLSIGWAEAVKPAAALYAAATQRYVYGEECRISPEEAMTLLHPNLWRSGLLRVAAHDPSCRATLGSFVSRAIRFMNSTGEALDLFGRDNVVFAPHRTGWRFSLIDPLHAQREVRSRAYDALGMLGSGQRLPEALKDALRDYMNLARSLNFLAELLGTTEVVSPVPQGLRIPPQLLLSVLSR